MEYLIDLFLHLDVHLAEFVAQYGIWVYAGLFAVIFAETGLVVTPFLPGDSLLFAAGALAATGAMDITLVLGADRRRRDPRQLGQLRDRPRDRAARVCGERRHRAGRASCSTASISIARTSSSRSTARMAVISSRFAPIIRTFVPFVAGAAAMSASKFCSTTSSAGMLWTAVCVGAGYAFGNVPIIKNNFSLVALGIVAVSLLPMVIEIVRARSGAAPKV